MDALENTHRIIESMIKNRFQLNDTEENQQLARAILEYLGEEFQPRQQGEGEPNYVQILNINLRRGVYLDEPIGETSENVIFDDKIKCLVTLLSQTPTATEESDFDDPRGIVLLNDTVLIIDSGKKVLIQLNNDKTTEVLLKNKDYLKWPIGLCEGLNENEILISDVPYNHIISFNIKTKESKIFVNGSNSAVGIKEPAKISSCSLNGPRGLTKDGNRIIVCDSNNNAIRIIENGIISTIPTPEGQFTLPTGVVADADGTLFVCDCENHCIQKITKTGEVTIIAGKAGEAGYRDGPTDSSLLNWPYSCVLIQGNLIFCEAGNGSVRILKKNGIISTLVYCPTSKKSLAQSQGYGNETCLSGPRGLFLERSGDIVLTESISSCIRRITPTDWETAYWIHLIQRNSNLMSEELLPEIIHYIAVMAFRTWRF